MINAGIVGLGWWGKVLVEATAGSARIKVTKGMVRNLDPVREYAAEKGFELVGTYDDLIADPDLDAVILATPHSLHEEQVTAAVKAGKHVFCEKPFTLYRDEAERAIKAATDAGRVLAVGHNRRFHPGFERLRTMIQSGELGKILHVEGQMSAPGIWMYRPGSWRVDRAECPAGGMTGMGVHIIDAIIGMLGPIESVYCQSYRLVHDEGLDDTTSVLMKLADGPTAYLGTSVASAMCFMLRVFGTEGWAQIDNFPMNKMTIQPRQGERQEIDLGIHPTETIELEAFVDAIENATPFPVPLDDVVHGVAVFRAICDSAESGERVTI